MRRPRFGLVVVLAVPLLLIAALFAAMVVTHQPVPVPRALVDRIETRANAALGGRLKVTLGGGAEIFVDEGFLPRVRFRYVELTRASGLPIAVLGELRATLDTEGLLAGRPGLKSLRVRGATVALRRLEDGRIDLDLGQAPMPFTTITAALDAFEAAFATPALKGLEQITAEELTLRLRDERLGRNWEVSQGRLRLSQDPQAIGLTLAFDVGEAGRLPAQVALTASTRKGSPEASFGAAVTDVPARDLALQSPALAVLGLIDAPISGSLRSGLDAAGTLERMDATLELGQGALSPAEGARPIPFEGAHLALAYDRGAQRVSVSELSFTSRALRFKAAGQALLREFRKGLPQSVLTQVSLSDLQLDPEGVFERPARFSEGAVDLRLRLKPFRAELGQLQLVEGDHRLSARGAVSADAAGWRVAVDTGIDRISHGDLLALWPPALVPHTRNWVDLNVATGELQNVRAALRLAPGAEPQLALGYEFRGADVRVLRELPLIREGRGFATIHAFSHALMVEEGHVIAPAGGQIEVADSTMVVRDIRVKPAPAEVHLVTRSPIPAALSLLDQKPFEFMTKAGRGTDIAEGWAEAETNLRFVMKKKLPPNEVDFDVRAKLMDVRSEKIVPGRAFTADLLRLTADRKGLVISGRGALDGVRFDGRWAQNFGPEYKGLSAVRGYVEITPAGLETFKVGLPAGMVSGAGWGSLAVDLVQGGRSGFRLETDLKGLALKIPEVGFAKAAGPKGNLQIAGALGAPPEIDRIALTAPGLSGEGRLAVAAGGGLERLSLSKLRLGGWFDGAVDLVGRGAGRAPDVEVKGGALDLRKMNLGAGGKAAGGGTRISGRLDRLTVAEGLALTGLKGAFTTRGGFSGSFTGQINGGAAVAGLVEPGPGGRPAVKVSARDAGAALASANIFGKARGGALGLTLTPTGKHSYDGSATATNLRVKDAPVLASMLSAASIIGLLEQLNGEGILFSTAEARFRLTPEGLSLTRGEALGASMGVTMTGNYYPGSGQIDMQGVISPFYIVNAIGQIFARKGEGLFGFTYSLTGAAKAPKVVINPLSIFTPGMFREIFRRAPPKLVTE
ncbi:hypothetical protein LPB142_10610 [Rhodobacter xanthinilyticus]|uniref:AsmA-like C-terminal domain-containing protein n=1 Tax=Rhodobacter xanthinilyticus TaxID=1850250 RepID=A0A1D9MGQ6_9RHOB|nr:hypothetical protein LPB142_10610 [Rhodobacter xanthinilyticus]